MALPSLQPDGICFFFYYYAPRLDVNYARRVWTKLRTHGNVYACQFSHRHNVKKKTQSNGTANLCGPYIRADQRTRYIEKFI